MLKYEHVMPAKEDPFNAFFPKSAEKCDHHTILIIRIMFKEHISVADNGAQVCPCGSGNSTKWKYSVLFPFNSVPREGSLKERLLCVWCWGLNQCLHACDLHP